jgi:hypothetical protein
MQARPEGGDARDRNPEFALLASTTCVVYGDRLGSATTVSDGSSSFHRDYGPFGDLRSGLRSGFTGHEHEPELGLVNMRG